NTKEKRMRRAEGRRAASGFASVIAKLARAIERALPNAESFHPRQRAHCAVESLEDRRLLTASVIINEFMSSNQTGYQDPAFPGQFPDWIELYNTTGSAVNLQGWQLKDGS